MRRAGLIVAAFVALAGCSGDDGTTQSTPGASTAVSTAPATVSPTAGRTNATTPSSTSTSGSTDATGSTAPPRATSPDLMTLPALALLLDSAAPLHRYSLGTDHLGVWICHVALGIEDSTYNQADLRLPLTPDGVAGLLNQYVSDYYRTLSHDRYDPQFTAEGEVSIAKDQSSRDCVDQALTRSADDIDGLVVVADAEHAANQPGGWGRPGDACGGAADVAPCPARVSGRATYIGASDFHPDWGAIPAVDLQEHELGHSLGLPHSGDDNRHTSALDLMSNSAAPRDVDPERRHAPDTLGVNRLALGWLDPSGVAVVPDGGNSYVLQPSNTTDGTRLLVLVLDELRFITVELLDNTGFNAHLPEPGIAVHLIDQRAEACRSNGSTGACVNELRRQTPLLGPSPHTDLLSDGETWDGEGWTVTVDESDTHEWTVTVS